MKKLFAFNFFYFLFFFIFVVWCDKEDNFTKITALLAILSSYFFAFFLKFSPGPFLTIIFLFFFVVGLCGVWTDWKSVGHWFYLKMNDGSCLFVGREKANRKLNFFYFIPPQFLRFHFYLMSCHLICFNSHSEHSTQTYI